MKILYHHRIGSKDGQYVHIEELQNAIRALGHEIVTVEPRRFGRREFGADSGLVRNVRRVVPKFAHELLEMAYAWIDWRQLRRAVVDHRPDCIYERYNLFTPSGAWAKRRFGLPFLVEVNAPLFEERSKFGGLALKRLARRSERAVWRAADYVLPVTEVLAGHVRRAGVDPSRIVVIPNGVNPERFGESAARGGGTRRRLGLDGKRVLGFTGFVREWHGLDRALDVVSGHGQALNLHLLIVGDGPGCRALIDEANASGVGHRVTLTGVVGREEVAAHVAVFDVALQPSVVPYASPLKIFEYLASGKAIVAPDGANIREILSDGVNALLFDPREAEAFGRAVLRLSADDDLRRRLGIAARRLIDERRLTWDHNADRIVRLFEELCGVPDGGGSGRERIRGSR